MEQTVTHVLSPIWNAQSKILILGTMPSPKSRENKFYYAHPQNRFWKVLPDILQQTCPPTIEGRTAFLLKNHIALWDVLKSCTIRGADDGSIRNPIPNDLGSILETAPIRAIFTTGKKATELYRKLCLPNTGIPSFYLPSTSPANCRYYSYEELCNAYRVLLSYLQ